jgi:hypothetical protein
MMKKDKIIQIIEEEEYRKTRIAKFFIEHQNQSIIISRNLDPFLIDLYKNNIKELEEFYYLTEFELECSKIQNIFFFYNYFKKYYKMNAKNLNL